MEQTNKPISGFAILIISLILLGMAIFFFASGSQMESPQYSVLGVICMVAFIFCIKGIMIVNPNQARVLTFFWKIRGQR